MKFSCFKEPCLRGTKIRLPSYASVAWPRIPDVTIRRSASTFFYLDEERSLTPVTQLQASHHSACKIFGEASFGDVTGDRDIGAKARAASAADDLAAPQDKMA